MDYELLLKKYMRLVLDEEGWSYLVQAQVGNGEWEFTRAEFAYLERLANRVQP